MKGKKRKRKKTSPPSGCRDYFRAPNQADERNKDYWGFFNTY